MSATSSYPFGVRDWNGSAISRHLTIEAAMAAADEATVNSVARCEVFVRREWADAMRSAGRADDVAWAKQVLAESYE